MTDEKKEEIAKEHGRFLVEEETQDKKCRKCGGKGYTIQKVPGDSDEAAPCACAR